MANAQLRQLPPSAPTFQLRHTLESASMQLVRQASKLWYRNNQQLGPIGHNNQETTNALQAGRRRLHAAAVKRPAADTHVWSRVVLTGAHDRHHHSSKARTSHTRTHVPATSQQAQLAAHATTPTAATTLRHHTPHQPQQNNTPVRPPARPVKRPTAQK